ncbi:acyl-CoA thioesterase [Anopheles sinensis]|uniref:Acyl-CoA thioesterase n=1 Tax=Anopheles sinensis TaxID=74873 RepID=A0A084VSP5_ANOSI|nr:acyl-CoA thioesterase [Anopheles sinensis]
MASLASSEGVEREWPEAGGAPDRMHQLRRSNDDKTDRAERAAGRSVSRCLKFGIPQWRKRHSRAILPPRRSSADGRPFHRWN